MVTIKDVANAAGVSFKTVSRVINNDPHVRDEMRQRVLRALEDLDYRPNLAARHLRTQKTKLIGLITDRIATTPFSGNIIKGVQEAAWRNEKILLISNSERQPGIEEAAISMMFERQVEGIIYAAWYHRSVVLPKNIYQVPVVLVNCYSEDQSLPSVVPDEVAGGYAATQFLLTKGHCRIGLINGKQNYPATQGRLEGYKQALTTFRVPFDETLVCYGGWWQEDGYENAYSLMNLPEPPTAIFCGNDRVAMGVYDALRELKLSVPDDVAVIGFDNQEGIAAHLRPGLTTMELPYYEMGQWAVDFLIEHEERRASRIEPVRAKLACYLIERAST